MLNRIRRWLAPPTFADDAEKNRVARLAHTILLAMAIMVNLAFVLVVVALRTYVLMGAIYVSLLIPILVALFVLHRGYVRAAALLTTIMLWLVLVIMGYLFGGVVNTSFIAVTLVIIIAALLLGARAAVILAVVSIVGVTLTFVSEVIGVLPPALAPNPPVNYWVVHSITYSIAATLLYLAMRNLTDAIRRAERLTAESEAQREQLQVLVQERTQDLERNANYLRATTAVARESAAALGDSPALLSRAATIVQEQFGFYHVGIYLVDETAEWVDLCAVAGAGQALLARDFRLRAGVEGMIGDVVRRGVYRLAADVNQDMAYLRVDELPDTRAELALPLQVRNQVIGVLDVQSVEMRAFTEQDVRTLQALADQVSMAISNARLVEQVRQAAEVERRAYGALTAEAWTSMLRASQTLGFYSNEQTTASAGELWQPEMKTALQTGNTTHNAQETQRLAVPVKVRGEVIGVIDFSKPAGGSVWTDEEITLVESLTEQLGVALDSARLYQDTQRRAANEQLLSQITANLARSLDMNVILQTVVTELGESLPVDEVSVLVGAQRAAVVQKDEERV